MGKASGYGTAFFSLIHREYHRTATEEEES
jgi:hypothetical protein